MEIPKPRQVFQRHDLFLRLARRDFFLRVVEQAAQVVAKHEEVTAFSDGTELRVAVAEDVDRIGGISVILKELSRCGSLNLDAMTVTMQSLGQNIAEAAAPDGNVVRTIEKAFSSTGRTAWASSRSGGLG